MPDITTPSPETGTPQEPSQAQGNETVRREGDSPSEAASPEQDWKTLYSESSKEGKRLAEEKKQLESKIQQYEATLQQIVYQQQQAQPAKQEPSVPDYSGEDVLSLEEARAKMDASLAGNVEDYMKYKRLEAGRMEQRLEKRKAEDDRRRAEDQVALASLQQAGVQDLQSNQVLAQKVLQKYYQLEPYSKPLYKEVTPLRMGNVEFHPLVLRDAIREARLELGAVRNAVVDVARQQSDHFIEPSAQAPVAEAKPKKFDASRHLSEAERAYCARARVPFENYWKNLNERIQEERLKRGEPVMGVEIGMKEIRYSIPTAKGA